MGGASGEQRSRATFDHLKKIMIFVAFWKQTMMKKLKNVEIVVNTYRFY